VDLTGFKLWKFFLVVPQNSGNGFASDNSFAAAFGQPVSASGESIMFGVVSVFRHDVFGA